MFVCFKEPKFCFVLFFFPKATSVWCPFGQLKLYKSFLVRHCSSEKGENLLCEIISYAKTQKGQSVCADFCSFTKKMMPSEWEHDRISAVSFSFFLLSSQPAWPQVWTLCKLQVSYKLFRLPNYCIIISVVELLPTSTFWVGQLTQPAPIVRDVQIFSHVINPDSTKPQQLLQKVETLKVNISGGKIKTKLAGFATNVFQLSWKCQKCQPVSPRIAQRQRLRLLRQDTRSGRTESIPSHFPANPGCFCCSLDWKCFAAWRQTENLPLFSRCKSLWRGTAWDNAGCFTHRQGF